MSCRAGREREWGSRGHVGVGLSQVLIGGANTAALSLLVEVGQLLNSPIPK